MFYGNNKSFHKICFDFRKDLPTELKIFFICKNKKWIKHCVQSFRQHTITMKKPVSTSATVFHAIYVIVSLYLAIKSFFLRIKM